jgi:hypothetical protein
MYGTERQRLEVVQLRIGSTTLKSSHLMNVPIYNTHEWFPRFFEDFCKIKPLGLLPKDVVARTLKKRGHEKAYIDRLMKTVDFGIVVYHPNEVFLSWLHKAEEDTVAHQVVAVLSFLRGRNKVVANQTTEHGYTTHRLSPSDKASAAKIIPIKINTSLNRTILLIYLPLEFFRLEP